MLNKFISDKINGTKNAPFFRSRALTRHSSTFNLRFLHELTHKVCLSKTAYGIFQLRFRLFLLKFMFLFNKLYELFVFKTP